MTTLMTLAQTAMTTMLAQGGGGGQGAGGGGQVLFIGLMLAVAVFWIITMRGNSKEKKQRQAMLDNLAKSDRVLTIGGIIGTVVAVKGNEVVIKVDEGTNTKMLFTRSAVQKVLTGEEEEKS